MAAPGGDASTNAGASRHLRGDRMEGAKGGVDLSRSSAWRHVNAALPPSLYC